MPINRLKLGVIFTPTIKLKRGRKNRKLAAIEARKLQELRKKGRINLNFVFILINVVVVISLSTFISLFSYHVSI